MEPRKSNFSSNENNPLFVTVSITPYRGEHFFPIRVPLSGVSSTVAQIAIEAFRRFQSILRQFNPLITLPHAISLVEVNSDPPAALFPSDILMHVMRIPEEQLQLTLQFSPESQPNNQIPLVESNPCLIPATGSHSRSISLTQGFEPIDKTPERLTSLKSLSVSSYRSPTRKPVHSRSKKSSSKTIQNNKNSKNEFSPSRSTRVRAKRMVSLKKNNLDEKVSESINEKLNDFEVENSRNFSSPESSWVREKRQEGWGPGAFKLFPKNYGDPQKIWRENQLKKKVSEKRLPSEHSLEEISSINAIHDSKVPTISERTKETILSTDNLPLITENTISNSIPRRLFTNSPSPEAASIEKNDVFITKVDDWINVENIPNNKRPSREIDFGDDSCIEKSSRPPGWGVNAELYFDPKTYHSDPSKAIIPLEERIKPVRPRRNTVFPSFPQLL